MPKFACFPFFPIVRKKKSKGLSKATDGSDLRVKPIDHFSSSRENVLKERYLIVSKSFPSVEKRSSITPLVLSDDSFASAEYTEQADYEGGDENSEIQSMKRDSSYLNLQPKGELTSHESRINLNNCVLMLSECVDDPGMELTASLESPALKRSCSNIEITQTKQCINSPKRSSSYSNLYNLSENSKVEITGETQTSLPSRSKKIRHRNLHKLGASQKLVSSFSAPNLQKLGEKRKKEIEPENQRVSFSLESSHVDRVNAWVNSLDKCSFTRMEDEQIADLHNIDSSEKTCSNTNRRVAEMAPANNIIQSLNTFSTVAHISGIGLKLIPSISVFACLRSINLSGNCIASITPGSLPKSLHTLDLSRNKIATIEGLRDLERLRVLNLSYNRIANISHGLSSCTLIKELYLAGNKISNVEGLHRLLKLTVLDLSFNKIITDKALGQLVANYNSLLALNLLGNPILTNIGDDQLKKSVLSFLPHVTYLNKQPIKPHKVREVVSEKVTKAALGDASESSKRKLTKRLSHGSGSLPKSKVTETFKQGKSRPTFGK